MGRRHPNSYGPWPDGPFEDAEDPVGALAAAKLAQVARELRDARYASRRNTQERMAELSGVSRYTISRLEAGSSWSDIAVVLRVAGVLGLDLNFIRRPASDARDAQ